MDTTGTVQGWDEWGFESPWEGRPGEGRAADDDPAAEQLSWTEDDTDADPDGEPGEPGELEELEAAIGGGQAWQDDAEEAEFPDEELGAPDARAPSADGVATRPPADDDAEDFAAEMLEDESSGALPGRVELAGTEGEAFPSGLTLPVDTGSWPQGSEHWDPHDTGLPLYVIGPEAARQRLARNFTVEELASSGGRTARRARISPELVRLLQRVRDTVGRPVRITSGYRSWARNQQIYQARDKTPTRSRHCSGQAADIKVAGMSGLELARSVIDAEGPDVAVGMGVGRDYLHVDVRGTWTLWTSFSAVPDVAARALVNAYRARSRAGGGPVRGAAPGDGAATATPNRLRGVVPYQAAKGCVKDANGHVVHQPGAQACAEQWKRLTGRRAGTGSCRHIGHDRSKGWSVHGEGRAIDAYADADDPRQKAQAEAYVAWLQANAVELQVAYIIWDARQWTWSKRERGWRRYPTRPTGQESKTRLHRDHVHIEITWEGCRTPSPLWAGDVPGWPA